MPASAPAHLPPETLEEITMFQTKLFNKIERMIDFIQDAKDMEQRRAANVIANVTETKTLLALTEVAKKLAAEGHSIEIKYCSQYNTLTWPPPEEPHDGADIIFTVDDRTVIEIEVRQRRTGYTKETEFEQRFKTKYRTGNRILVIYTAYDPKNLANLLTQCNRNNITAVASEPYNYMKTEENRYTFSPQETRTFVENIQHLTAKLEYRIRKHLNRPQPPTPKPKNPELKIQQTLPPKPTTTVTSPPHQSYRITASTLTLTLSLLSSSYFIGPIVYWIVYWPANMLDSMSSVMLGRMLGSMLDSMLEDVGWEAVVEDMLFKGECCLPGRLAGDG